VSSLAGLPSNSMREEEASSMTSESVEVELDAHDRLPLADEPFTAAR
jgi:hypothetical protein